MAFGAAFTFGGVPRNPPVIAVIDDEEPVRRALGRLLDSAGYAADVFASGRAFLDSLATRRPDCILLDLHMPEMDGFAVLRGLPRSPHQPPVIIITGDDTAETRERLYAAGVAGFFRKPFDGQQLVDSIQAAVERT